MTAEHLWIPYTKLHAPHLRVDLVARKRVIDLLHSSIQNKPLTLISAPAGYGKTTLVSHVLAQTPNVLEAYDVAWLSLDEGDDDPALFMTGLVAALKQVDPALGLSIETVQKGHMAPHLSLQQQVGLLINDIGQVNRKMLILVLDDLHTIQSLDIHQALDYLVQRMPPQMRVVITTRVDPMLGLARLRARGELAEIRPPDLRFTMAEAATLLNEAFGLDLQENELRTLHTNVEGWAAGLRLVAASLSRVQTIERAGKIDRLARVNLPLFDLLAEEVLSQQPPAIQKFLLATSVLDELTPDLCRAVTEDQHAPQLLAEAYRRNLFLVAKEEATEMTYQYHDLFAHFLRHHLAQANPGQLQIFHRRAGDAEPNAMRAIRHYLAAKAYEPAAQRIEQVAEQMFEQGLFARLHEWIGVLPEGVLHAHPWLNFYMGMVQWWQSQYAAAQQVLEKALAAFESRNDQRGCGEAMVQLSIVHQTQGDFAPAVAYIQRALDRPISPRSRCQSFMALAWLSLAQGQLALAANQLDTALTLAETGSDEGAVNICMIQTRFVFECVPGGPTLFPRLIHLLETKHPAPLSPRQGAIFGAQSFIHLLEGNVTEAISAGEQARSISQHLGGLTWLLVDTATILAILYSLRRDTHRFDVQVVENEPLMEMFPGWRRIILYAYGYMYWTQGRLDKMEATFVRMQTVLPNEWPTARVCFEAMQGVRAMVANDWTTAKTAFQKALDLQRHTPVAGIFADTRLLLAIVHERCHEPDRAVHYMRTVLDEYIERGKPGLALLAGPPLIPILKLAIDRKIHVNVCQHLLAQLTSDNLPEPLFIPQTQATLTARELEVLRLLMGGASNQEIAETLIISLPTVKTHVSRILNKLNVKSRAAVVARVQELNLPI